MLPKHMTVCQEEFPSCETTVPSPTRLGGRGIDFLQERDIRLQSLCDGQTDVKREGNSRVPPGNSEPLGSILCAPSPRESREATLSNLSTELPSTGDPSLHTAARKKVRHDLLCSHEDSPLAFRLLCVLLQSALPTHRPPSSPRLAVAEVVSRELWV